MSFINRLRSSEQPSDWSVMIHSDVIGKTNASDHTDIIDFPLDIK